MPTCQSNGGGSSAEAPRCVKNCYRTCLDGPVLSVRKQGNGQLDFDFPGLRFSYVVNMPPLFVSYSREQGARQITPLGLNE